MEQAISPAEPVCTAEVQTQSLTYEEEEVLSLSLSRPTLPMRRPLRRIERYYRRLAAAWWSRWEGPLYQRACEAVADCRARSRPFKPWTASLSFTVTYQSDDLLSLQLDAAESTGGRPTRCRWGDVWDLSTGTPLPLRSLLPPQQRSKRRLLETVDRHISARLDTGEAVYYEDWPRRVRAHFSPDRSCLSPEGQVVLFYPPCTLAPYMEGIPTFLID